MPSEIERLRRSHPRADGAEPRRLRPVGRTRRRVALACGVVVVLGLLSACGSSDDSSSAPEGKEQVCAARDQLEASVSGLVDPDLLTEGTDGIRDAVDQVADDVQELRAAAGDDYGPQVEALQTDLEDLQNAVTELGAGGVGEGLAAVGTAITAVGTDASELFSLVSADCE